MSKKQRRIVRLPLPVLPLSWRSCLSDETLLHSPFIVDTKISTSQRNRPAELDKEGDRSAHMLPGVEQGVDVWSDGSGMPPSKVADHLFDAAISSGDFRERAVAPSRV